MRRGGEGGGGRRGEGGGGGGDGVRNVPTMLCSSSLSQITSDCFFNHFLNLNLKMELRKNSHDNIAFMNLVVPQVKLT